MNSQENIKDKDTNFYIRAADGIKYSIPIYRVDLSVIKKYRSVKGNYVLKEKEMILKLSRNIALASYLGEHQGKKFYRYGYLRLTVKGDIITNILNHHDSIPYYMEAVEWVKDEDRYNKLNEEMGLVGL